MTGTELSPSDEDLLDMALGGGPDEVAGGWEALLDADLDLRVRFEAAARRARLIRTSRAALDLAPACARALMALRRAKRSVMSLQIGQLETAEAFLGPAGPSEAGDLELSLGATDREQIVELEQGARVFVRLTGADVNDIQVVGIDRMGTESSLRLREDGDTVVTEAWRLEAGEAPVVLGCRAQEGGESRVGGWVVLVERESTDADPDAGS